MRLVAVGMRNQEVADQLVISLPTVKRHIANSYGKLGVDHRTEAVARTRELGLLEVKNPSEELLASLARYEVDAARYSLRLFHEAGVRDLDQWLANFAACDIAYLLHFYRTGEKRLFRSFWVDGAPLLDPLAIPSFQPTKWVARSDTVI